MSAFEIERQGAILLLDLIERGRFRFGRTDDGKGTMTLAVPIDLDLWHRLIAWPGFDALDGRGDFGGGQPAADVVAGMGGTMH